jgi:hypothetical protein
VKELCGGGHAPARGAIGPRLALDTFNSGEPIIGREVVFNHQTS